MRADETQGAHQRRFFADQLLMLFAAAGRPALKKVVSGASAISRSVGSDRTVSVQRISDWRSGKRVPASFESVHPVLVVLIRYARELTAEPPAPVSTPSNSGRRGGRLRVARPVVPGRRTGHSR